jgi:hypothetical protein
VLDVDVESVDLARERRLCKESVLGRSESSKRWWVGAGRSSDRLSGSA